MKSVRIILFGGILAGLLTSCNSLSKINTSDNDDVYLDPKRDRKEFYKPDVPKVVEPVAVTPVAQDSADNNPYYKAKDFSYDDYYDNQYASRLKRFHAPMYGVGYYTNSYFYNNNPNQYGVSIYNGYSFWGPSYNTYMYGSSFGYNPYCSNNFGWGGNNFGYNNYGYNSWNNPYYGNNFGGWNNQYYGNNYGGWGNPYYNNFGNNYYGNNNYSYNNGYDYNSATYNGPRISHSGGNSKQVINPGYGNDQRLKAPNAVDNNSTPKTAPAPTDIKRFEHIQMPKENLIKLKEYESAPRTLPTNTGTNNNGFPVNGNPKSVANDGFGSPKTNTGSNPIINEPKPIKGKSQNNEIAPIPPRPNNSNPPPKKSNVEFNNSGGGKSTSFPSNNNSGGNGGTIKPSGGGGTIKPRR